MTEYGRCLNWLMKNDCVVTIEKQDDKTYVAKAVRGMFRYSSSGTHKSWDGAVRHLKQRVYECINQP